MNPSRNQSEAVSLQMGRYGGPPWATFNGRSTCRASQRPHHLVPLQFCLFKPLRPGLAALIFSLKARDRMMVGDVNGARRCSSVACCLNIWATVLSSIIVITLIAVLLVLRPEDIIPTACPVCISKLLGK